MPTLRLALPSAHLATGFTDILSITELRDGGILIADRVERAIVVADFSSGAVEQVGGIGQGPGEYMSVTALMPLGGDSSLMADVQARRWLILDGATIPRTVPASAPAYVATMGLLVGAGGNGVLLSKGRITLEQAREPPDSVVLVTVGFASGAVDTVANLAPGPAHRSRRRRHGPDYSHRIHNADSRR